MTFVPTPCVVEAPIGKCFWIAVADVSSENKGHREAFNSQLPHRADDGPSEGTRPIGCVAAHFCSSDKSLTKHKSWKSRTEIRKVWASDDGSELRSGKHRRFLWDDSVGAKQGPMDGDNLMGLSARRLMENSIFLSTIAGGMGTSKTVLAFQLLYLHSSPSHPTHQISTP